MSPDLRQVCADYLAMRRALGFKLAGYDRLLADFVGYLERCGARTITVEVAVAWAGAPVGVSAGYVSDRLCVLRGLARYLQGIDPSVEIPPGDLLARRERPRVPNLYSQLDIARLVEAAGRLEPALRGATYQAVFGLLAVSGMRVGEVIALDRGDVDFSSGVVSIAEAKFRKHCRLPLHPSTLDALRRYAGMRDRLCPSPKDLSFFVSGRGTRLLYFSVRQVFVALADQIGLEPQPGTAAARIHHLRHSFAVATVQDWHREGADPEGKLPTLSAYLGHADPAYTYIYLHACPELLGLAAQRLERWEEDRR